MKNNKPYWSKRAKTISVSLFEREFTKGDKTFKSKNTVLQRGYKKKDSDEWTNETMHFSNIHELKRAMLLLEEAEKVLLFDEIEVEALPSKIRGIKVTKEKVK